MYKLFFFISSLLAVVLVGCQSGKLTFDGNTESGHPYVMHVDKDGPSPVIGDKVSYLRRVRLGQDSVLAEQEMTVILPTADLVSPQAQAEYEMLFRLSEGDSASVYMLGEIVGNIPGFTANDTIIFDISFRKIVQSREEVEAEKMELMNRKTEVEMALSTTLQAYKAGKLQSELQTTEMGLKYIIHEEGTGNTPDFGANLKVNYYGMLMDGSTFDNSFERGEAIEFPVGMGQVIPGWDLGLMLLKKGGKATLIIPYDLAYGETGFPPTIPEKADLIFYVELVDF